MPLDREKAREALLDAGVYPDEERGYGQPVVSDLLDRLAECVTPDRSDDEVRQALASWERVHERADAAEAKVAAVLALCDATDEWNADLSHGDWRIVTTEQLRLACGVTE